MHRPGSRKDAPPPPHSRPNFGNFPSRPRPKPGTGSSPADRPEPEPPSARARRAKPGAGSHSPEQEPALGSCNENPEPELWPDLDRSCLTVVPGFGNIAE
ncbi:alpha carbonic anhydrase 8-like [Apteryx rowi]|uniref:alpha carbonic anhydrase 8-like n=1 Tax=Apteryx rowi TaxID=308060 RepID=UPI000E1C5FA2|nr:alpha carbonic anhydrase 8-like [Apteryx rowi]